MTNVRILNCNSRKVTDTNGKCSGGFVNRDPQERDVIAAGPAILVIPIASTYVVDSRGTRLEVPRMLRETMIESLDETTWVGTYGPRGRRRDPTL